MIKYIDCYTIPEQPIDKNKVLTIEQTLTESRQSGEYQLIYVKLDELGGTRTLTSTYIVSFNGSANDLLNYILGGLKDTVKSKIELFVFEFSNSNHDFFLVQRQNKFFKILSS